MRKLPILLALTALFFAASIPASAAVVVKFADPVKFADSNSASQGSTRAVMREIERHLHRLGAQYLQPNETLTVEVLDIDLAGQENPFATSRTRVMRSVTPPRFNLRYTLVSNGKVMARGDERISDHNYLMDNYARRSSEALAYEKALLTNWFRDRFASVNKAGRK